MEGVSIVQQKFEVSPKELSQFVEDRNDGAVESLKAKYTNSIGLAKALKVDVGNGLSSTGGDIETRKNVFGSNKVEGSKPKTFCELCWEVLQDFTLIMLILCAIVSLVLGLAFEEDGKGWIEGVAIFVSVIVVVLVSAGTDYMKNKQFQALRNIVDDVKVDVQRDGKITQVSLYDLVVGDIVWVKYGDLLPADGILIEGSSVKCDESALTGEPILISKITDETPFLLSGTKLMEGSGKMMVIAVGANSQSGIIKNLASGNDAIAGWESLDGVASVTNGSPTVKYTEKKMKLTNFVNRGNMIRLGEQEYTVQTDGFLDASTLTLSSNYVGTTSNTIEVSFLPDDSEEEESRSVLQVKLERLAVLIGYGGTIVAAITVVILLSKFLINIVVTGEDWKVENWKHMLEFFITGVTILVVAVPEGLPLAVTLSLSFSTRKMLKYNNLVKHIDACETMGSATAICSDKTGTLTTNRMTVVRSFIGKEYYDEHIGLDKNSKLMEVLSECAALNSGKTTNIDTTVQPLGYLGNKTECALLTMVHKTGIDYSTIRDNEIFHYPGGLKLFPFNSSKKRMSVVVPHPAAPHGRIYTKGASEIVLELCDRVMLPDGSDVALTADDKLMINDQVINAFADEGLRTLCLAYRDIPRVKSGVLESKSSDDEAGVDDDGYNQDELESNLILIAVVGIEDPVRAEVPAAIKVCNGAGIAVKMVTGDNIKTARSIARKCGILPERNPERFICMEGPDFRKKVLDDNGNLLQGEFDKIWPRLRVLARSSPKDKYTLITGMLNSNLHIAKANGDFDGTADYEFIGRDRQVVAVTGDGTNDAPALAKADVGFAMGIAGTEVAKDACDIVLQDDNFSSIVKACMWGRNVYDSIGKFLQFQLTVNLVAIIVAFIGAMSPSSESPLKPVQLLWVNLIMDSLASLALATEPPSMSLLERKPYGRNDAVINKTMAKNIIGASIYQLLVLFFILFGGVNAFNWRSSNPMIVEQCLSVGQHSEEDLDECAKVIHYTILFNIFVLMTLFNEIVARKLHDELNIFSGLFANPLFVGILVVTAVGQVIVVQYFGEFFEVHSLTGDQWWLCIAFSAPMLVWGVLMHMVKPDICGLAKLEASDADDVLLPLGSIIAKESSVLKFRSAKRQITAGMSFKTTDKAAAAKYRAALMAKSSSTMGFPDKGVSSARNAEPVSKKAALLDS